MDFVNHFNFFLGGGGFLLLFIVLNSALFPLALSLSSNLCVQKSRLWTGVKNEHIC